MAGQRPSERFRVLIAGGGVAALEAILALRATASELVHTVMLAPDPEFRYRPLSVTEPFGLSTPRHLDLAEVALEHGGGFIRDALEGVDVEGRVAHTSSGRELDYDALLIAVGARAGLSISGATPFWDVADRGAFRDVLARLEDRRARRLVFAVPSKVTWPLPLYELALLTAARVRERGIGHAEIVIVTPEPAALSVFGPRASGAVADLLVDAGVNLRLNTTPTRFANGYLEFERGDPLRCEDVVSLPVPETPAITGIPQDRRGFIPVDRFGGVLGCERVFAAGDATMFPVKQGGVATQAADSAASAIAALAGAEVEPQPFRPVLRGALLTESGPRYMRKGARSAPDAASRAALWWPPAKIAGRHLAPYLARRAGYGGEAASLRDLDPPAAGDPPADSGHDDVVAAALSWAGVDAEAGDFRGALRWLEVAEDLELYLPPEAELNRIAWQERTKARAG